jgi:hypothetical protein
MDNATIAMFKEQYERKKIEEMNKKMNDDYKIYAKYIAEKREKENKK